MLGDVFEVAEQTHGMSTNGMSLPSDRDAFIIAADIDIRYLEQLVQRQISAR